MLVLLLVCHGAIAAEDVWQTRESSPVWQSECGSCHMAFPPAMFSNGNWQLVMRGLDKHFGVNAMLEPKVRDEIAAFLDRNSGSSWSREADSMRITETGYFKKRHQGGIKMLNNGRIKSLADCLACHK